MAPQWQWSHTTGCIVHWAFALMSLEGMDLQLDARPPASTAGYSMWLCGLLDSSIFMQLGGDRTPEQARQVTGGARWPAGDLQKRSSGVYSKQTLHSVKIPLAARSVFRIVLHKFKSTIEVAGALI